MRPVTAYAGAAAVGLIAVFVILPVPTIFGLGPGWAAPSGDQAQALAGHLAFQQQQGWLWPPLTTDRLFWPRAVSIALTDSNPLVSLLARAWVDATGGAPVNLLGAFLAACWFLQPVAAVYALRALTPDLMASAAASVLSVAWPALMIRMGHVNLCGHFIILFAIGLALRRIERPGGWIAPAALLLLAVFIHPYLFQIAALVLASIPLDALLRRRTGWRRALLAYGLSGVAAVAVLRLLSGPLGGGDKGFVVFSMNLLSPVWPQRSGVFGADLPLLDATGGQAEGFAWLGAGVLLLAAVAGIRVVLRKRRAPGHLGLVVVLAALAIFSLSSRVYAGHVLLLDLGAKPWEDVFGTFRTPGRAFWPVGYAVMLGSVAVVAQLGRTKAAPLLLLACVLQLIDVGPLQMTARRAWDRGADVSTAAIPRGTSLFGLAPYPGCTPDPAIRQVGPLMLLDAVRGGARVEEIGVGRPPAWFSCERIAADLSELPLLPGETRAFLGAAAQAALHARLLGPGSICRRTADTLLCGRDVSPFPGERVEPTDAEPDPARALPAEWSGAALAEVLGSNWMRDAAGDAWSEGPYSTLLVPIQPGMGATLILHVTAIADARGGMRVVDAAIGRAPPHAFQLRDGTMDEIVLPIDRNDVSNGVIRVSLATERPIDPRRRGVTAPVRRAALQLERVELDMQRH